MASRSEWRFEPLPGNPAAPRRVRPPLYAGDDPFELGNATPDANTGRATPGASPFGDVQKPRRKKSPFLDDLAGDD